MIKTAQRRFILITLSILFAVFAVIFTVFWAINGNNFAHEVQISLSEVERQFSEDKEHPARFFKPVMVAEITAYDKSTVNYSIVYGEDNFSAEDAEIIIKSAFSRETDTGNVGNVFFSKKQQPAKILLFTADMSVEAARFHSSLIKTLILLIVIFAALSIVVWGLSFKVFEPIKRILAKQKQFISDASHELKTPVSIISANADVIRTTENETYVDSIKNQVDRLKFLVSDMLSLARLDEGNVKTVKETFNLSDEITQTVLPFDAVAFEKGKTLDCDIEKNIIFEGSKDGVKQIINILLDNAVKYSADGGEIKVSLKKQGAKILLSVYNDGSLIPESDSDKIFERFYRGDVSRSRNLGGNGLGLSIAKSIALTNRWEITAKSVFGKSMTITLTM